MRTRWTLGCAVLLAIVFEVAAMTAGPAQLHGEASSLTLQPVSFSRAVGEQDHGIVQVLCAMLQFCDIAANPDQDPWGAHWRLAR